MLDRSWLEDPNPMFDDRYYGGACAFSKRIIEELEKLQTPDKLMEPDVNQIIEIIKNLKAN